MQKCRINSARGKFHLRRRLVFSFNIQINVRENRRGNQEWKIQRHWHHWVHKTPDEDKQNKKHNTENENVWSHLFIACLCNILVWQAQKTICSPAMFLFHEADKNILKASFDMHVGSCLYFLITSIDGKTLWRLLQN